jgi:hypothetical protein
MYIDKLIVCASLHKSILKQLGSELELLESSESKDEDVTAESNYFALISTLLSSAHLSSMFQYHYSIYRDLILHAITNNEARDRDIVHTIRHTMLQFLENNKETIDHVKDLSDSLLNTCITSMYGNTKAR